MTARGTGPGPTARTVRGLPQPPRAGRTQPRPRGFRNEPSPAPGAQAPARPGQPLRLGDPGARGGERRERDSNPRYPFGYAGLANLCLQPLGHLSKPATAQRPGLLPTEEVGFEPTKGCEPLAVFKTAAFSRSAIPP